MNLLSQKQNYECIYIFLHLKNLPDVGIRAGQHNVKFGDAIGESDGVRTGHDLFVRHIYDTFAKGLFG